MAKTQASKKSKGGRPSKYSPELVEEICRRLATGEPMAAICREEGMPAYRTVKDWADAREDVSALIARAREEGFDAIALQCLEIADRPQTGVSDKYEKVKIDNPDDPKGPAVEEFQITERKVEDMLGHRKLQIETRLKLLAKWDPKRYGEKVQLADAEGDKLPAPPQWIVVPTAPAGDSE